MKLFVESVSLQREMDFKQNIILINSLGDKIVLGHPLVKNAKKIDLIKDIYYDLFKEDLDNNVYTHKAREGEELIEFMLELSDELSEEDKKNNRKSFEKRGDGL